MRGIQIVGEGGVGITGPVQSEKAGPHESGQDRDHTLICDLHAKSLHDLATGEFYTHVDHDQDDGWHVVTNAPSIVMMQEAGTVPETSGGLFQKLGISRSVLLVVRNASFLKCLNPLQLTS